MSGVFPMGTFGEVVVSKLKQIVDLFESGTTSPKAIAAALKENGVEASTAYVSSILSRHRKGKGVSKAKAAKAKVAKPKKEAPVMLSAEELGESDATNTWTQHNAHRPVLKDGNPLKLDVDVTRDKLETFVDSLTTKLETVTVDQLNSVACLWRCCDRNEDMMHAAIIRFMSMVG